MSIIEWSNPDEHFSCDACLEGLDAISSDQYFHAIFRPLFKIYIYTLTV